MILGIDFDNTIVKYDSLFHKLAVEHSYIDVRTAKKKSAVRDAMNSKGMAKEFTKLQGEVYGKRIVEALKADNMLGSLETLYSKGVKLVIVSHKTKYPIEGPKYDLREAAING